MKVVFLDIDGVVNTLMISKEPFHYEGRSSIERDGFYYDLCSPSDGRVSNIQALTWLEKICKDYNLSIVLSSTWRFHYEEACEALYNSGLSKDIKIVGATPRLGTRRGIEIQAYLDEHPEVEDFIIIDDDLDMCHLMKHLIWCHTDDGITNRTRMEVARYFENPDKRGVDSWRAYQGNQ